MSNKIKIEIEGQEKEFEIKEEGKVRVLGIPIKIEVAKDSFLHIGATLSPLTEKKAAVFKVDRTPIIPATSFKGALRHQLELLFINNTNKFTELFNVPEKEMLKPCIPSPRPTKAEQELINRGKYREHCEIRVDDKQIDVGKLGVCPVCYFMGTTGLMGFLRFSNFYPEGEGNIIDQTNIRIDRKTGTAAHGAKVEGEQVKPGTVFKGTISVVISEPILAMQNIHFGNARKIGNVTIDKWLENWQELDKEKRIKILIEKILLPAVQNIKVLGGQKSRGAGKVNVELIT